MNSIQLFCLPFAGGSKYSYRGYAAHMPPEIVLNPIELPGRGTRFKEPLLTDIHAMVDDIFQQLSGQLQQPYAIYGHSMGGLLGYLLTHRIIAAGLRLPERLFFSGCVGPAAGNRDVVRHSLPKHEFVQKIRDLGGMPDEVLADDSLIDFFEPILRADFHAVEGYRYVPAAPLSMPIDVMIGIEERATYDEAMLWQKETVAPVSVRQFPGKHFFIFNYEREIVKVISSLITPQILPL